MDLGAFSVSLAVKDIRASQAFYQALGFEPMAGDASEHWLILRNGDTVIGLFENMLAGNMLTFNPRWDQSCAEKPGAPDIRTIQQHLLAAGIALDSQVEPGTQGPGSLTLKDPDGNLILLDQHC